MRKLILLPLLLLALAMLAPLTTVAHAPEKHGFKLVAFRRPLPAPEFSLTSPVGTPVNLRQFRGKVVLLNFWATWCLPCVREMPSMEALYQKFKEKDFVVLAVSLDEKGAAVVKPFLEKYKLTFSIALDQDSAVSRKYGAGALPSSFLINRKGQVIAAAKGERDWFSADAVSYMAEILAKEPAITHR